MTVCNLCALPSDGVFVGRQQELRELRAALDEAIAGRGRLLMLAGEPGIGKTRTSIELAAYAESRNVRVLWGRCYENEGAPPYWPWIQAIRSYMRERDAGALRSEMGAGIQDIAAIVPDIQEMFPDLPPSSTLEEPEHLRFRLFNSVSTFLAAASHNQPIMLILDNLHGADKSSLLLLEFLAQETVQSRLLVVGTYRDVEVSRQHPLFETLG
jgi:predicted ATPase